MVKLKTVKFIKVQKRQMLKSKNAMNTEKLSLIRVKALFDTIIT